MIERGPLWQHMDAADFPSVLCQLLQNLQRGNLTTASGADIPIGVADFDSVFLTGGRVDQYGNALINALASLSCPVIISGEPVFGAAAAGLKIVEQREGEVAAIDVGQTRIKLAMKAKRGTVERSLEQLPCLLPSEQADAEKFADSFSDWIAYALAEYCQKNEPLCHLLLGVPCEIRAAGGFGACSYFPALSAEQVRRHVIERIQVQARLPALEIQTINDAHLAGYAALTEVQQMPFRKTLVLTLGWGMGASLLCR